MKNFPDHPKIQHDEQGNLLLNFGDYGKSIEVASFSGDGSKLLTVQEVRVAKIWDLASGNQVGEITPTSPLEGSKSGPTASPFIVFIESSALNSDGSLALLGLNDGTAGVFRVSDNKRLSVLQVKEGEYSWGVIRAVNYSHDGSLAVVGFFGRKIGIWDSIGENLVAMLSPKETDRLFGTSFVRDTMISSITVSQDNHFIFAGNADMTACVWDLRTKTTVMEAYEHAEKIIQIHVKDGRVFWGTTAGNIWKATKENSLEKILATRENWKEMTFSPQGTHALTRSSNGQVSHHRLEHTSEVLALAPPRWRNHATSLGFGKNETTYFYPLGESSLKVVSGEKHFVCKRGEQLVKALLSPQHDILVTEGRSDFIELWSLSSEMQEWLVTCPGGVGGIDISQDGTLLAAGDIGHGGGRYPRNIYIWDIKKRKQIYILKDHCWQIKRVAFGPKGDWLVSIGDSVRFWQLKQKSECPEKLHSFRQIDCDRSAELKVLANEDIVIINKDYVEVRQEGLKKCLVKFPIPYRYRRSWSIDETSNEIFIACGAKVDSFCLQTGCKRKSYSPPILFPDSPLPTMVNEKIEPTASGYLWRVPGGPYIHTGDGPRGWVTKLQISSDGKYIVIPGRSKAAVVDITGDPKIISTFPFEGQLRDSRILQDKVVLVNSQGKIFHSPKIFSERNTTS